MSDTPHELIDPPELPRAVGFSHAAVAAAGRLVFVAGQIGEGPDGKVPDGIAQQMDLACANVVTALRAAGAEPEHAVWMQIFTTDLRAYRDGASEIGEAYRRHFGKHYPAMALVEVSGLFEPAALVEVTAVAVVPETEGER
jgi:enamine deaminase RidA (YjgF/YER057c/UK114 family)